MKYLLDTNVLSETTRPLPSSKLLEWMAGQLSESLFLSAITIGELHRGALMLPASKRRKALLAWLATEVEGGFQNRVLPLDDAVMKGWAQLQVGLERKGRRMPLMDSLLAATARTFGLVLVTRNVADFKGAGVDLLNPWE